MIKEKEIGKASDGRPVVLRFDTKNQISKENKREYHLDKRMQELRRRGFGIGNIHAMLFSKREEFPVRRIESGLKAKGVRLDGGL